jgi:hypothetical protein
MKEESSRRKLLKNIGVSGLSVSALSGISSAEKKSNNGKGNSDEDDEPVVSPDLVTNWTSEWSPYTINLGDESILKSRWDVNTGATGVAYHRFDALVEASKVKPPQMVSTNIGGSKVFKDWEYTQDTALGVPAYHFKAKMWVAQPTGSTIYLDSRVEPTTTGDVEARSGCYFDPSTSLGEVWSVAYLNVE